MTTNRFSKLSTFLNYGSAILLILIYCSCTQGPKKEKSEEAPGKTQQSLIIKKPESSFNDTLVIKGKSAVFYTPDSEQLNKIKQVNKKTVFDLLTHNCHYQMQNALVEIREYPLKIKIIQTSRHRYLLFQKENNVLKCIDLNNENNICGVFFFDGKKDPALIDMPNVDTQLNLYFYH